MRSNRRHHATVRYYGQLNDFLPLSHRHLPLEHVFELPSTVKDMFEAMGVPHPEVELILINGTPENFDRLVQDGDWISIYPAFSTLDLASSPQLRPELREHRFVLDAHLGRLAAYLRLFGFDVLYQTDSRDEELAQISHRQQRVLLTRDCGLLKRSEVIYGYFVRATDAKQQLIEVLCRFDLFAAAAPFTRCLRCNAPLHPVAKQSIAERLPPKTRQHYDEFYTCPVCQRIYWAGSHYRHMNDLVREVLAARGSNLRQHGNHD